MTASPNPRRSEPITDEAVKLCCATAYQQDAVGADPGRQLPPWRARPDPHAWPARSQLPRRCSASSTSPAGRARPPSCSPSEFGVEVDGVDLGELSVAKANAARRRTRARRPGAGSTTATPSAATARRLGGRRRDRVRVLHLPRQGDRGGGDGPRAAAGRPGRDHRRRPRPRPPARASSRRSPGGWRAWPTPGPSTSTSRSSVAPGCR